MMNSNNELNSTSSIKSYESLDFTDDFLFCKILTTDLELTRELLEIILNKKIREVRVAEPQKSLKFTPNSRGVRFDVYVEDDENVVYDVEMQATVEKYLGKRARYYQGMIDLNLIESGEDFSKLNTSFVIFVLKNRPKDFPVNLPIYTFRYRCEENPEVELKDEAVKVIVNAEGPTEELSPRLANFLKFIRDQSPRDEFTKRLDSRVKKARESREWRAEYMTFEMKLKQARNEGRAEGMLNEQKKAAQAALSLNIPVPTIVETFGIPEEIVNEVLEERKANKP